MKLMVIDGNSILNRAFYGIRMLTTREGTPTNAVYGFLTILLKLLEEESPDGLCVTFDRKAPTFRHLEYEGYKAQRKGMPEELAVQLPLLKEVLDAMNVPRFELDGWEADDLIGTISVKSTQQGWDTVVVTGDKDSLQLITEHTTVKLVTTRMGQTTTRNMTPNLFREEYGFDPIHIIDLKALMGDASDNIPGVKGIGEKTAMGLIQSHHSLDEVYAALPAVFTAPDTPAKAGVLKKLEEGREDALLSYRLATIRTDAPIPFAPSETLRRPPNAPLLRELFLKLEFSKLMERMELRPETKTASAAAFSGDIPFEWVTTEERGNALLSLWETAEYVTLLPLPDLSGLCVVWNEAETCAALLFPHRTPNYDGMLQGVFSPKVKKNAHGVKSLMTSLLAQGFSTEGFVFDTELAAYLLAPTEGSYDLERLAASCFSTSLPPGKTYLEPDAFGLLSDPDLPAHTLVCHTALIHALFPTLSQQLTGLGLDRVFSSVELPLCPVLARMEREGLLVDREALSRFGEMLQTRISQCVETIYELAGEEFNINSTQQLGKILFDKLGLPPVKKTKTGYSTNAEVLEKLRGQHPILEEILTYRQYAKLNSTYVEGLAREIGGDGRIHTCFQNTVTATGRLSSTEPNLQNIPVRTELGAKMRDMFIAREGWVLVDADYSQIELRILAHMAQDETMIGAFRSGTDIHTVTASQVFGGGGEVTGEMRRRAKAVNFGIVYGISDFSLSQDIGVTRAQAKAYMDKYFETYAGVRQYQEQAVEQAKKEGFAATLLGRRRRIPELTSSNFNLRSFGERVAMNMPIQGTAADIIKLAMIRVDGELTRRGLQGRLVLQVHDELLVECPREEAEEVKALLEKEMSAVMALSVPLPVDAAIGASWGEAH